MQEMIRRINLWGGPGISKSTTAMELTAQLKRYYVNIKDTPEFRDIELVREYAKEIVWAGQNIMDFDQFFIFAEQLKRENDLIGGRAGIKDPAVDLIVTDCPLGLAFLYARNDRLEYRDGIREMARLFESRYPSLNILLDRGTTPYVESGRIHTHEQAIKMDQIIDEYLQEIETDDPDFIVLRPEMGADMLELVKPYLKANL